MEYYRQEAEPTGKYAPLSPWAYFGYSLLFAIPVIGLIFLIVFSVSNENINRRNFARSYWCVLVLVAIVFAILLTTGTFAALLAALTA